MESKKAKEQSKFEYLYEGKSNIENWLFFVSNSSNFEFKEIAKFKNDRKIG